MKIKSAFFRLLSFTLIFSIYITLFHKKTDVEKNYHENYEWMLNNNVMQYSCHIFIDKIQKERYRVEAYLHGQLINIADFKKEKFKCLIRSKDFTIELDQSEDPDFPDFTNRKFVFNFNSSSFDAVNAVIAVIRVKDYDNSLDDSIIKLLWNVSGSVVLPYSMINYQKPTITIINEPRLPEVGLCVHYNYNLPSYLVNWAQMQSKLGLAEVFLYDGTENNKLTKVLRENSPPSNLIINPFNIDFSELCNEVRLLQQFKSNKYLDYIRKFFNLICKRFYDDQFKEKFDWRRKHERITSNDCFSVLSHKYEFVAHYDIDEFIFPRSLNYTDMINSKDKYECKEPEKICSLEVFKNNFNNNTGSYFYNYVKSIIASYRGKYKIDNLRGISFDHSFYIPSGEVISKIMDDIGRLLDNRSLMKNDSFVLLSHIGNSTGHVFQISNNEDDYNYLNYLKSIHSTLFTCFFNKYNNRNDLLDKGLSRFFYYITENKENGHIGKTIHFSKKVRTISTHRAIDHERGTWVLNANQLDGHCLSHFRPNIFELYRSNRTGSIKKLRIDFEYLVFVLKNNFEFCAHNVI